MEYSTNRIEVIVLSEWDQMKSINSGLSNRIDELATFANMLDQMTHDEATCGEQLEKIMQVVERLDRNIQATKSDYRQLGELMKKRSSK